MFPVFGREANHLHPCVVELTKWADPLSVVKQRAIARNVMHDDRVSQKREIDFLDFVARHSGRLDTALRDYFKTQIRTQHSLVTVYHEHNQLNLASGPFGPKHGLDNSVMLVRVLELNGLKEPVNWAIGRLIDKPNSLNSACRRLLGTRGTIFTTENEFSAWLNEKLRNTSEADKEELMIALLEVMNQHRKESPFQPVWATSWNFFQEHAKKGQPNRWSQALGVNKDAGRWLAVLIYQVGEAGDVARPTFLDADMYEYHFPSPASEPPDNGGHPMELRTLPSATRLLPEFIHKQLDHKIEHWLNAGSLLEATVADVSASLEVQRSNHYELLGQSYGQKKISTWMPQPC
ncbi:MAG TPA: hypothetical protein PLD20_15620 [Blastocatellia bacterium]|nr:hypothetical protein [Blastocatellia bacterium]HMX24261.1 hypothetical protein [Blastocatellia bacterium]HMZ19365.1 hypothetical protein [Blastocatellia bacterium]HNG29294.1 hypothetical protein [Blastocatellia bacterium]